jgi:hypothetical protein
MSDRLLLWWPQIVSAVLAAITIVLVMGVCAPFIVWARQRKFRITEAQSAWTDRKKIAAEWGVPDIKPGDTRMAARLQALGDPLTIIHENANHLQTVYHYRVARCVSCLGFALGTLALSSTILRNNTNFESYAAVTEVACLVVAFQQWWSARLANHSWVATRTKAELLRQWTFLSTLFGRPTESADEAQKEFDAKAAEIDARVLGGQPKGWRQWLAALAKPAEVPGETIESRIWTYWDKVRGEYAATTQVPDLTLNDLNYYLSRRPVRQLAWFRLSQLRLQRSARIREFAMAALFILSIILAAGKAALVFNSSGLAELERATGSGQRLVEYITFGLLAVTMLSTALTTLYLSRNDRSLSHRYATQERRIEEWLRRVARPGADGGRQQKMKDEALEFERLMVDELVDWIHISSHDAIELAP